MFNYILKWTSNAIMMRDDGNTLHSCLINSCCVLKVSSVADHVGSQDTTAKSADFDDDEGGLLLSLQIFLISDVIFPSSKEITIRSGRKEFFSI